MDIVAIPASSAPVERVFLSAGELTIGKRNRFSDKILRGISEEEALFANVLTVSLESCTLILIKLLINYYL